MAHWRKPQPPDRVCEACKRPYEARQQFKNGRFNGWHQPKRFCTFECYTDWNTKRAAYTKNHEGYIVVVQKGREYREHRLVMEKILGRKLKKGETVHHKDGNRANNSPDNLELWSHNHGPGQRIKDADIWSGMIPAYQHGAL